MRSALRATAAGAASVALVLFAWLSVEVYRAQADPERFEAWGGRWAWIVGPGSKSLNRAAGEHLARGLEELNDTSKPAALRLARYREHLAAADRLFVRSLRANPAQARVLAQLAAIRWETEVPATDAARAKYLDMIETASRMAPRVPDVQVRLGELLLKMGRQDEAIRYLVRAIELDPQSAGRVVALLHDQLLPAADIAAALPRVPKVLAALAGPFADDGGDAAYLDLADGALASGDPELLEAWAGACLRARDPARLRERMDRIGKLRDPALESRRLRLRSSARLALGDRDGAFEDARAARTLSPSDPGIAIHLGQTALGAGRPEEAVRAFRDALSLVSRGSGDRAWRASLYAQIGAAEEAGGKPDLAYDAYRQAATLDPAQETARRRLSEMKKAAGL